MGKRILWLTENYPPQRGGMAQSCDRIVDHLRRRNHTIDVFHFTGSHSAFQQTQQLNGWYATAPFDESESHTLNIAWEFLKQQPVDALVCFGGYLPMLGAPVFSKWLSVPLVTMIRGNDFDTSVFTPRKRDLLRDAMEASQVVCAVSKGKQEKIKKLYPAVEVQHAPNGIDAEQWQPSPSEHKAAQQWRQAHCPDKICVGLFGQLKKKKGIHFLLDALRESSVNARLYFLLIGEIPDEVAALLAGSDLSYTHYEFLDRYELMKYYLCCDAVSIPSYYDGMPNVLLEAGALGIPVIASDVDGMHDVLVHQQNGLLFEPGDAASCRKAFFEFISMGAMERRALGLNLQSTIATKYTVENECNYYDQLFKNLLDGDRGALRLHAH